ncbi:MAG: hypothetical protein ABWX94_01180 [Candidatus Saccharimonadales bacterium]
MNPNSPNQPQQMPGAPGPYAGPPPAAAPYPAAPPQGAMPMPPPPTYQDQPAPLPPAAIGNVPPQAQAPQQGQPVAGGFTPQMGSGEIGASPNIKPANPAGNPNSTQNMLQIAEIRDGFVIMNDGSFRSVVMVNSINFDLMSQGEQEAVEYNYQNFLNSLYFPIQIFLRSQKVDLTPYIEKLDKIRSEHDNMLLALLMDDYIGYMESLAQQTNIMDKKFYIIIPFFPHIDVQKAFTQSKNFVSGFAALFNKTEDHVVINEADLEKAKTELKNRVQTVLDGLLQCNVQSLPLDTQELIELFYDTYNPDTATRQQLKNFDDMNADFVNKGQGPAPQPQLERGAY